MGMVKSSLFNQPSSPLQSVTQPGSGMEHQAAPLTPRAYAQRSAAVRLATIDQKTNSSSVQEYANEDLEHTKFVPVTLLPPQRAKVQRAPAEPSETPRSQATYSSAAAVTFDQPISARSARAPSAAVARSGVPSHVVPRKRASGSAKRSSGFSHLQSGVASALAKTAPAQGTTQCIVPLCEN